MSACPVCGQNAGDHCQALVRLESQLRERDAQVAKLMEGMEIAWGIIANANGGDWDSDRPDWKAAAIRWRDECWHPALRKHVSISETEPKP